MIKAYYYNFNEEYKNFVEFSSNNFESDNYHNIIKKNFKKVSNNRIYTKESFFYIKLLEKEIIDMFNNNFKTRFMIEIDQKSSSSVFLSLVLGNKKLSEKSNLISNENDPPKYLMNASKEFFDKIPSISDESKNILYNNRDLHKQLFMRYCYNQSFFGRVLTIIDNFNIDMESAQIISKHYNNFLNRKMDGVKDQINRVNKIVKYVIKRNNVRVLIKTINGYLINWKIFKKSKIKG